MCEFEFKDGDEVFIRWCGGNSGEYKLAKVTHPKGKIGWYVYMWTSGGWVVNYKAGEVFMDTESVELICDEDFKQQLKVGNL